MTEGLKKGWTKVAFGDVVRQVKDRVDIDNCGLSEYLRGEHFEPGNLKIIGRSKIGDGLHGSAFHMKFQKGDVLYVSRNPHLRKVALADFNGICANTTYVCRANENILLQKLLPFIMQTEQFVDYTVNNKRGSTNFYLNWSDIASYEFALPPMEEQYKIVRMLTSLHKAIEALKKLAESYHIININVFEKMLHPFKLNQTELGEFLLENPRNGYSAVEASVATGHWVLSLSALTKHGYRQGELKAVEKSPDVVASTLQKGDLLISRSNTIDLVGLVGIFDEERNDVSWPDTIMKLVPDEACLKKQFIELYLRSKDGRRQIQSFAAGTSSSMKKINSTNVKKLLIPNIIVEDQVSIITFMNNLQSKKHIIDERIKKLQFNMKVLREIILTRSC